MFLIRKEITFNTERKHLSTIIIKLIVNPHIQKKSLKKSPQNKESLLKKKTISKKKIHQLVLFISYPIFNMMKNLWFK
jgi:hypothetical protein